jgi:hypothetical protein
MNIAEDGHLSLHLWDLREEGATQVNEVPKGKDPQQIASYHSDAQIAAAYAWLAGHKVTFAAPGILVDVKGTCRYFNSTPTSTNSA